VNVREEDIMVPWFDVDAAVAEMNAVSRQVDALLGTRGLDGRHGLGNVDTQVDLAVREEEDAWVLTADAPGVSADDVEVSFDGGALTVRARRQWALPEDVTVRHAERRSFTLDRSARLPDQIDTDGIEASFALGVLTVRLPKRPRAQPRSIPVHSA
jgi:HSP20 family protein